MAIAVHNYEEEVKGRSRFRFVLGLFVRALSFVQHERVRRIARKNGATIGKNVVLPLTLAKSANSNLIVGDDTVIASDDFDLREPIRIGSHVIIGKDVKFLTQSHNIDSVYWETVGNGGLEIEDYVWCATDAYILPGCRKIGMGAVIGAAAVVVKNVEQMAVMGGNPARDLRKRQTVHASLIVSSVSGGDLISYFRARCKR